MSTKLFDYNGYTSMWIFVSVVCVFLCIGISEYVNEPEWLDCIKIWEMDYISKIYITGESNELQNVIRSHSSDDHTDSDEDFDAADSRLVLFHRSVGEPIDVAVTHH